MDFSFDDDDFDDAFFEEVDKLEILATASTQQPPPQPLQQQNHHFPVTSNSKPVYTIISSHSQQEQKQQQQQQQSQQRSSAVVVDVHTHSPPRELSQRNPNFSHSVSSKSVCSPYSDEQFEIERLKNELSSVSKELLDLKQECSELKKQRERDHQLNIVHSSKKSKTCKSEDYSRNVVSPKSESAKATADHEPSQIGIERKSTAIQTDNVDGFINSSTSVATFTYGDLSKLLSIWSPLSSHRSRRNFVAKLLEACASEFCALFGCFGAHMPSVMDKKSFIHASMPGKFLGPHSIEESKIAELYSVLTKLADDMVHINAFVAVLLDLCGVENVLVVCKSLHILRIALENMLHIDKTCSKRVNVKVVRCDSGSDAVSLHDLEMENTGGAHDVDWLHLFSSMVQFAAKLTEENARVEAVSIMNIILMRTDPSSTREKFGVPHVFEVVALLLRKEAGVSCRKEAVHLLYLLLNCPSILVTFCLRSEVADSHTQSPNDGAITLACQESSAVLEGLADCLVCSEHGVKELSLRRNAIILLSFLASSGKGGFEIFLFHKLPGRANFLGLVLQVMVSEIDAESLDSCPTPIMLKERTSLMREALILLNRLASHPAYSTMVLQALTSCRDMVSLAIDIATMLSKKSRQVRNCDCITQQMREYEVVDLACLFRKRVFTSLGETISS